MLYFIYGEIIMGLKEYIKNKKKYKTDDLYVGSLFDITTLPEGVSFNRIAILRKMSKAEVNFKINVILHSFILPDYIENAPKMKNPLEFYTHITPRPQDPSEFWAHGMYAHSSPSTLKKLGLRSLGHHIFAHTITPLREVISDKYQLADTINYEFIKFLEDSIQESLENNNMEK
jgi:hypothetical protein